MLINIQILLIPKYMFIIIRIWVIFILLNLPAEICVKSGRFIIPLATPGPNPPGNIESYIYPLFEEMAMASQGIWTWDAVDSSYFLNRAFICMAVGDTYVRISKT
jgi:hypothetical protein